MRQEAIFLANKMIIRIKIMRTRIIHLLENIRLFRRMHRAGTAAPAESPIQKPGGSNKQNAHLPFPSLFCIVSLYCLSYISIGNCGNEGGGNSKEKKCTTAFVIWRLQQTRCTPAFLILRIIFVLVIVAMRREIFRQLR